MPLAPDQLQRVVRIIQRVNAGEERVVFMELMPMLNLSEDEAEIEFARVVQIIRYLKQIDRDHCMLRYVHMHAIPCAVQAYRAFRVLQ
jgi:hypothetical protein